MKRTIVILVTLLVLTGGLLIFLRASSEQSDIQRSLKSGKIQIVTSFYPLADFAKQVGGDRAEVTNITPSGAEPHDYEPTPLEIAGIYQAALFLYNGNGVDGWADHIADELRSNGVRVIRMSDQVDVLATDPGQEEEGAHDPHFWLDPRNVQKEVGLIASILAEIDPENADAYASNRDAYLHTLAELDKEYQRGLAVCASRTIVTTHNAFRYLAERYSLTSEYILGLSPDEEPSPKRIAEIAELAKKQGIGYIFFETLVSPAIARTVAEEIGAKTLVLNPIEGLTVEELKAGKDYVGVMRENLAHLKIALSCQENTPS